MWRQTGSFAHNAPNSPGLLRPWRSKGVCFGTMELEFGDSPFFMEVSNALGWFSRRGARPTPSKSPLSQGAVFHHAEFCLPGAAPMGWGHWPALSLNSHHVYARKPGIQVFLMIWVLILFLLRLTKNSYLMVPQLLF